MSFKELLVKHSEAEALFSDRKSEYIIESVSKELVPSKLQDGYEVFAELKTKTKVRKKKPHYKIFENKVWTLFYKMGYTLLNGEKDCNIEYKDGLTKQIDVFACDDETAIIVECKSASTFQKNGNFKENLESYYGMKQGLIASINKELGKKKVIFIYATNNYEFGEQDKERCKTFNIVHFNEDAVDYYTQLVEHLGSAAKYQLLGTLLRGQKVSGMNLNVPAIQGKMGGHTYYSFLIEPAKLLKIGFVLHRNNAHSTPDMMPTYQRIIKKERLKSIREFVNDGGYFPNSIIVSIDTKSPLQFDRASQDSSNNIARMGILHLPQVYQCAYIIDGQHRLYGYSESDYAENNTIPVIAFENLEKEEQVKMFMDINENQKPVPKTLRSTLEIDLLWTSKKDELRRRAVMLSIAQSLGEEKKSPLYGRVITGENQKTPDRTLTLENLRLAFYRSGFFNSYKSGQVIEAGLFDYNDNNKTFDFVYNLTVLYLDYLKDNLTEEWNKSSAGYLLTNDIISALITLLGDMVKLEVQNGTITPLISTYREVYNAIEPYVFGLVVAFNLFKESDMATLKPKGGGGGAPLGIRKFIGWKLSLQVPEFNPDWLQAYTEEDCQDNHEEALHAMNQLLLDLREVYSYHLLNIHGDKWQSLGIPDSVYKKLTESKSLKQRENDINGIEKEYILLDFATFEDYAKISQFKSNWSSAFKSILSTDPKLFDERGDGVLLAVSNLYARAQKNGNLSKSENDQLNTFCNKIKLELETIKNEE